MIQNYIDIITKKYVAFDGRATRSEYWYFFLANLSISILLYVIVLFTGLTFLTSLYSLAVLLPGLAVGVRRLHDIGKSGLWLLIALTGIGAIVLIVFYCLDSEPGANQYGPNPKGVGAAGAAYYGDTSSTAHQNMHPSAHQQARNTANSTNVVLEDISAAANTTPSVQPVNAEPVNVQPVWVPEVDSEEDDDKTIALIDDDMTMAIPDDDDDDKTVALIDEDLSVARLTRLADNKVITCHGDAFSVGKSLKSSNYVISENEKISRRHATFYKKDGQYFVVDSSKNGTKVNGAAVVAGEYTPVRDGDKITFADEAFIFNIVE